MLFQRKQRANPAPVINPTRPGNILTGSFTSFPLVRMQMTRSLATALFILPAALAKAGAGLAAAAGKFLLRLLIPTMAFTAIG